MQFHYVVYYDTDTRKWHADDDVDAYFRDGNVYDEDSDWRYPDEGTVEGDIDLRCWTMLNTLASIWPEVDHGDY